jgi:hypothetical protein
MGYSQAELDQVQERWGLRFPPDLVELLLEHRPLLDGPASFDWLRSDPAKIKDRIEWPFETIWFDVEHDQAWWPEWGKKPADLAKRRDQLMEIFAGAPKLIPLFGHRYIPEEPCERGNPVFSVYQTDVIYYGANLQDWLDRERDRDARLGLPVQNIKVIPFWSEAVARNNPDGHLFLNRIRP